MKRGHHLRYVRSDQVYAGELDLERMRLKAEGATSTIGRLSGALIDTVKRRIAYLVVETRQGEWLVPFQGMCIEPEGSSLRLIGQPRQWERFDQASVDDYDAEAVMALLFGNPAA